MAEAKGTPAYAVTGALIIAALAVGYWFSGSADHSPASLDAQLRAGELRQKEQERSEKAALARLAQQRALDTGTRALELLESSLNEERRWRTEVEPLLSNAQGRVLAGDPLLIEGFLQAYDAARPSRGELEAARPRIDALLSEPRAALSDPNSAYQPGPALVDELERERAAAEVSARTYRTARERVESVVAGARLRGAAPAGVPLEQAIAEYRARGALASTEAEAARRERHRQEAEQKQAQLDETLHKQRLAAMEEKNAAEQRALEQQSATDRQLVAERARREKLLALANDPAVQSRFAPFLTPAHYVLGCGFHFLPCRYERAQPESYAALQRMRVFDNLKQLGYFASRTDPRNDRPKWPKPTAEEQWAQLEADQKLFAELAPIWVEQGKLAR